MSETQVLLSKIAALRQRLEQARSPIAPPGPPPASGADRGQPDPPAPLTVPTLVNQAAAAREHDRLVDQTVREVAGPTEAELRMLPRRLTSRGRRVLELGREQLVKLRALADAFAPLVGQPSFEAPAGWLLDRGSPLTLLYRDTVSILDATLRMIPLFPDTTAAQLSLSEGVEGILQVIDHRLQILTDGVRRYQQEQSRISGLAELFRAMDQGTAVDLRTFQAAVLEIHADANECGPLQLAHAEPTQPERFAAARGLSVARVVARMVRHDPELRVRALDAVLAGLLLDVGMVRVPVEILTKPGPLNDEQRRQVEGHCRRGADLVSKLLPDAAWLSEAVLSHHERLDGTGYPEGRKHYQQTPLARLLAVCDVYAALCSPRPHRPGRDPRTALADTLLMAELGLIDQQQAERLLNLSFYPIGSAVEMADGSIAVVVATPPLRRDLNSPARPVVAVLLDSEGRALSRPRHLDLSQCEGHSIIRTLPANERSTLLGPRFPEWA